ncbi:MAG: F0F1 ATP synthase subunit A [Bacteroidia bacterium]|nr:F0F1 ATP synthase subunit A [Bacteroidia bacterium]
MILDHIKDSYDWHIADIGGKPVSISLPVILLTKDHGLLVFSSSEFHHGHSAYTPEQKTNFQAASVHMAVGEKVDSNIIDVSMTSHYVLKDGHVVGFRSPESGFDYHNIHDLSSGIVKEASVSEYFNGKQGSFIDLSITKNVFSVLLAVSLLLIVFISVANAYKANPGKAPKGIQSFVEPLILFIRDEVAKPSIGHGYEKFLPYLLSLFFFIWFNNMMGLIPIFPFGANVTGNIAVTLILATFTFVTTQINAKSTYWKHIFMPDVPWWLYIIMIPIEIFGVFIKPVVLTLRLFANITAGHIIALAFFSLIFIFGAMLPVAGYGVSILSIAFTVFMNFMELLVAFLQAYVFTLLSAIYIGMAIEEHH